MTSLQKSIAEIEAMIKEISEAIPAKSDPNHDSVEVIQANAAKQSLQFCIQTLTSNLEYERGELKNAYNQGHFDGNDGCEMDFNDYYTKTYGQ